MALRVHAFVQDANNLDVGNGDAIVNNVMSDGETPVAGANPATIRAKPRVFCERGHPFVQFIEIAVGLNHSPVVVRPLPDGDEIFFRGLAEVNVIHPVGDRLLDARGA